MHLFLFFDIKIILFQLAWLQSRFLNLINQLFFYISLLSILLSELACSQPRFLNWLALNLSFFTDLLSTRFSVSLPELSCSQPVSLPACSQPQFLYRLALNLIFFTGLLSIPLPELACSQPRFPNSLLGRAAPAGNLPERRRRPVLQPGLRRGSSAGALRLRGLEGVAADGVDEGEEVLLHPGGVVLQATAGALGGLLAAHAVEASFGCRSSSA